jgi:molecular chaperone HscB
MDAPNKSYFDWFGLAESFALDRAELDAAYLQVQATVHPDRFARGLDSERRMAIELATQANEAFRTLRDPARRAAYLCRRHGVDLQVETNTSMPGDFLIRQMGLRELLDDARQARDEAAVAKLRDALDTDRAALLDEIGQAIDQRHDFEAAGALVRQLMFLDKFGSEIDDAEDLIRIG